MQKAMITILSNVDGREIDGKFGKKTIYSQKASLETDAMRITVDVEVDSKNDGYRVGETYEWDVAGDLVPGKFGAELARRKTLVQVTAKPSMKAA